MTRFFAAVLCILAVVAPFLQNKPSMQDVIIAKLDYENELRVKYGAEDSFRGSNFQGYEEEYIDYHHKTEEEETIIYNTPKYYESRPRPNTCANIAGAIVVGYYDRVYDDLIPNFVPGRYIRDIWFYNYQNTVLENTVIDSLYTKMNTDAAGTTQADCLLGLRSHVLSMGRNISYTALGSGTSFNMDGFKQAIADEKPVLIFASGYNLLPLADFNITATQDKLYKSIYNGNHVMVAYGCKIVKYFDVQNNLIRQNTFLKVSTGWNSSSSGYLMLNDRTGILGAQVVGIS